MEKKVQELNESLFLYRQVVMSEPQFFFIRSKRKFLWEKISYLQRFKRHYLKWSMAVEYSYDGIFEDNILIVGQTSCGKTTFSKTKKNITFLVN